MSLPFLAKSFGEGRTLAYCTKHGLPLLWHDEPRCSFIYCPACWGEAHPEPELDTE